MKRINEITQRFQPGQTPAQPKFTAEDKQIAIKLINYVFQKLKGCCTAWKHTYPDNESLNLAKQEWLTGFIENGISTDFQIHYGLKNVRKQGKAFVPTIGDFIKFCQPKLEELGLPEAEVAYREACRHSHEPLKAKWSHQAVYEAAKQTGFFELKSMAEKHILPVFTRNYDIITKKILKGEPISDIPKALPGQVQQTLAERNKAYHDEQQQQQIQQAGLSHLSNKTDAMAAIKGMLNRGVQ
ncbi:Replication protein P [Endozoicomonas sp. SM1973]|uniref:Replication protein P n=1 Tax=Spartinivicinus marinus TaxID=2994442 RepID=A0A853ILB2_9GAMM|nr:replication protein P [Spartinivicinus marinus]NYZ69855.1 Replication protein P [Spartinivicinus marinus]